MMLCLVTWALQVAYVYGCSSGMAPEAYRSLSKQLQTDGPIDGRGKDIKCAQDLNCDFTFESPSSCDWTSTGDIPFNSVRLRTSQADGDWRQLTRKDDVPFDGFAGAAATGNGGEVAVLQSATIECQKGGGMLSFRHWASSTSHKVPIVRVCIIEESSRHGENCLTTVHQPQANHIMVHLPPVNSPFMIRIKARDFTTPSFVAIDDIQYKAETCGCGDGPGPGPGPTQCTEDVREALECDFERGDTCNYDNFDRDWTVARGKVGNIHQGVRNDGRESGFYAYVGSDAPGGSSEFVLRSLPVCVRQPSRLVFDLFQRNYYSRFHVCRNDDNNCLYMNPPLDVTQDHKYGWYRDLEVCLDRGEYELLFVASEIRQHAFVGLDNVRLLTGSCRSSRRLSAPLAEQVFSNSVGDGLDNRRHGRLLETDYTVENQFHDPMSLSSNLVLSAGMPEEILGNFLKIEKQPTLDDEQLVALMQEHRQEPQYHGLTPLQLETLFQGLYNGIQ